MRGGDYMDAVLQMITTVGFPIVACLFMGWYVKYQTDNYRAEVKDMQKEHKEEITKVTEALNNNTIALQKLVDKLDSAKEGD